MSEWQPIETAPSAPGETKRHILVYLPAIKCTAIAVRDSAGSPWLLAFSNGDELVYEPTHWMPLPDPPSPEAA